MNRYTILFLWILKASSVQGQGISLNTYGLPASNLGCGTIASTVDGGFITSLSIDNAAGFAKFDSTGNLQWTKRISKNSAGSIRSIATTAENIFIIGSLETDSGSQLFIMMCDDTGNSLWTRTIIPFLDWTGGVVTATSTGGCFLAIDVIDDTYEELLFMEFDAAGNQISQSPLDDSFTGLTPLLTSIIKVGSTDYIFIGYAGDQMTGFSSGLHIFRFHPPDQPVWYHTIEEDIIAAAAVPTSDHGFVVCGGIADDNTGLENVYVAKFSVFGYLLWSRHFNIFEDQIGNGIAEASNGDLLISGTRTIVDSSGRGTSSALIIRLTKSGELKTINTLDILNTSSEGNSIMRATDGGFVLTGSVNEDNNISHEILIGKLNSKGDGCMMIGQLAVVSTNDSMTYYPTGDFILDHPAQELNCSTDSVALIKNEICSAPLSVRTEQMELKIFLKPNPARGIVSIESDQIVDNVVIFNDLGITMLDQKPYLQDFSLDLSNFLPGTYYVRLSSEKSVATKKIIKK